MDGLPHRPAEDCHPARWRAHPRRGIAVKAPLLQLAIPYHRNALALKWMTLVLFLYIAGAFSAPVDWSEAGRALVLPQLELTTGCLLIVVAVFGTIISPYMFFWHSSQEVEERRRAHRRGRPPAASPRTAGNLKMIVFDPSAGMVLANLVALFIMITPPH